MSVFIPDAETVQPAIHIIIEVFGGRSGSDVRFILNSIGHRTPPFRTPINECLPTSQMFSSPALQIVKYGWVSDIKSIEWPTVSKALETSSNYPLIQFVIFDVISVRTVVVLRDSVNPCWWSVNGKCRLKAGSKRALSLVIIVRLGDSLFWSLVCWVLGSEWSSRLSRCQISPGSVLTNWPNWREISTHYLLVLAALAQTGHQDPMLWMF